MLPEHIFFTGVPGSRWSGIAQIIETIPGMNTSDRTPEREYIHHNFTGHKGAYFGEGMELQPYLDHQYINSAWIDPSGCKLVKSHDWANLHKLNTIKQLFPDAWIMMVYRPDQNSFAWWHEAGGFQIKYPNYSAYKDSPTMLSKIIEQNSAILEFGMINNSKWEYFTSNWIADNFSIKLDVTKVWPDILVTIIKP